jgi:hypothetical protein
MSGRILNQLAAGHCRNLCPACDMASGSRDTVEPAAETREAEGGG